MESDGWRAHPDADAPRAKLPPVEPGRVVGLGARCDLDPQRCEEAGSQSFAVSEFVTLEDGRRVLLHEERGFALGLRTTGEEDPGELRDYLTADGVIRDVLNVVLPDDDESAEQHPWSWLAELARARGLHVTAEDLRTLRYEVILTDRVKEWLAPAD